MPRGTTPAPPTNFYPRPPRGGRLLKTRVKHLYCKIISIHALREEGDPQALLVQPREPISIHALREEGDTSRAGRHQQETTISIHALREEGDALARHLVARLMVISIHALREEGDASHLAQRNSGHWHFYPRPPRGGRQRRGGIKVFVHDFYPRPPRGGRPILQNESASGNRHFYPRPPRGGRLQRQQQSQFKRKHFYPRPPRGGRPDVLSGEQPIGEFLSTPSARRATTSGAFTMNTSNTFLSTPSARRATCVKK